MKRLKREAIKSCVQRGHKMTHWHNYDACNAVCKCQVCNAEVQCLTRPLPNQIDIAGEAVAVNCPSSLQGELS